MRRRKKRSLPVCYRCLKAAIFISIVWLTSTAAPSSAQMPTGAPSLEFGGIEFENDMIAVIRMHMAPHERTPMHDIPSPRLVIWLTDMHLKDTDPDGRVSEYKRPAGSVEWITPRRHMGENLSDHGLDFLAIIPKAAAAASPHHGPPH
jgi:hypothetical protein